VTHSVTFHPEIFALQTEPLSLFRQPPFPGLMDVLQGLAEAMRRRDFIKGIGGTAAGWPLAARAQRPTTPVIGVLIPGTPQEEMPALNTFKRGLSQSGYVEGQSVTIESRWAEGRFDRLPAMAADLVRRGVSVIVTLGGTITVLAAKGVTTSIPILFSQGGDPVKAGLVASLNRPGGNVTGTTLLAGSLDGKRVELLHEVMPQVTELAMLRNPNNPNSDPETNDAQAAAASKGLRLRVLGVSTPDEIDTAYGVVAREKIAALIVGTDPFLNARVDQLVALAARYAVPAIYGYREFAVAGGLLSYGASRTEALRQLGIYAARVLKGEKPADLPVQQAVKIELVLNLKTAKALGTEFPLPLLARADEVIE
jgi:putative ABC transport system substrate-binding protein